MMCTVVPGVSKACAQGYGTRDWHFEHGTLHITSVWVNPYFISLCRKGISNHSYKQTVCATGHLLACFNDYTVPNCPTCNGYNILTTRQAYLAIVCTILTAFISPGKMSSIWSKSPLARGSRNRSSVARYWFAECHTKYGGVGVEGGGGGGGTHDNAFHSHTA